MYRAVHRSAKGGKCDGRMVSDRSACGIMAKIRAGFNLGEEKKNRPGIRK